jgi:hypothetical protein
MVGRSGTPLGPDQRPNRINYPSPFNSPIVRPEGSPRSLAFQVAAEKNPCAPARAAQPRRRASSACEQDTPLVHSAQLQPKIRNGFNAAASEITVVSWHDPSKMRPVSET